MNKFQLYFSLIFGVLPYDRLNANANIFLSYVHMYVAPLFYFTCVGIVVFGSLGFNYLETCGSICRPANDLFIYLGLGTYVFIQILTLLGRKKFFIDFEKAIKVVDDCLSKYVEVGMPKEKEIKPKKTKFYFTWFMLILFFTLGTGFEIVQLIYFFGNQFLVLVIVSSFPYFASSFVMGQFVHYVSETLKRMTTLNKFIRRIHHEIDSDEAPVMIYDVETEIERDTPINQGLRYRHNADHTMITQNNNTFNTDDFNDANTVRMPRVPPTMEYLTDFFEIHEKILRVCMLINAKYSLQCIPYMITSFIITILGIFFDVKILIKVGGKNRPLDYVVVLYFIWSFATMLVSYLVLRFCSTILKGAKESALILHGVLQRKPAFLLNNDLYYNKIKSFILQYLQWERYFQFNSIGLYILDYTYLFVGLCAAISYLIVLLQFEMTPVLEADGLL